MSVSPGTDDKPRVLIGLLEDGIEVLVTVWSDEDGGGELAFRDPSASETWGPPVPLREED